jgi:hypothetical protein
MKIISKKINIRSMYDHYRFKVDFYQKSNFPSYSSDEDTNWYLTNTLGILFYTNIIYELQEMVLK